MKKIEKILKGNLKVIVAFIIGLVVAGSIGVYASTVILSSDVEYSNENSKLEATTVQKAIDELYEKATPTEFKVGDYVKMTPTKTTFKIPNTLTGYNRDQTINPSELNLWRVIKINNDNTVDVVSVYVSSVDIYFSAKTGYQNYVGTLNYISKQYENQKYTSGSRNVGYDTTSTEFITDTSTLTSTTAPLISSTSSDNVSTSNEVKGLGDISYETDYNLVKNALGTVAANKVGTTTAANYWLSSRIYVYKSSTAWSFSGRIISPGGAIASISLYDYNNGNFSLNGFNIVIRPIVTLKSNIKASNGVGTSDSPYVLS